MSLHETHLNLRVGTDGEVGVSEWGQDACFVEWVNSKKQWVLFVSCTHNCVILQSVLFVFAGYVLCLTAELQLKGIF